MADNICWSKTASISQRRAAGSQDKDQGVTVQLKVRRVELKLPTWPRFWHVPASESLIGSVPMSSVHVFPYILKKKKIQPNNKQIEINKFYCVASHLTPTWG